MATRRTRVRGAVTDHERIPERVVHARGAAAHGTFRVYKSLAALTRAQFLQRASFRI